MPTRPTVTTFRIVALLLAWLVLTNRWMGWSEGIEFLTASDAKDYETIARLAPALPTIADGLPTHKVQRFAIPWALGCAAKLTGSDPVLWFRALSYLCIALILGITARMTRALRLSTWDAGLCLALLILNPYTIRYYLIVPGMTLDLLFGAGLAVVLSGLLAVRPAWVVLGCLIAIAGRQTALLIIPSLWVWTALGPSGGPGSRRVRLTAALASSVLVAAVFGFGSWVARDHSAAVATSIHMTDLFRWTAEEFDARILVEHALRSILPHLAALALLAALILRRRQSVDAVAWIFLLLFLCVSSQAFLGGPGVSGRNASRLSAMGLLPLVWAITSCLRPAPEAAPAPERWLSPTQGAAVGAALLAVSLHHMYSWFGPPGPGSLTALQLAAAFLILLICAAKARPVRP